MGKDNLAESGSCHSSDCELTMSSHQVMTAACPTCGAAGRITIDSESSTGRRVFRFACPAGHQQADELARQLWIGAHN